MARVLLVDDERDVVTLIKFMLEKDGHMVVCAYDGAEALAKAGVEPRDETAVVPDLVILDVMMPVMDGESVRARLEEDERTRAVPVIVLTAKGAPPPGAEPARGAYLEKPFDPKALRDLVAAQLRPR
ncbi:MAG: response regulator [Elusimicrobiota bacterium]|nr:MAG: response regulator [Elusimicrobiota bacterium]